MNSEKYSYTKITNPSRYSPVTLLKDLLVRSNHYSRESRNMAKNNMVINKRLTLTSLIISFTISLSLSLSQVGLIHDNMTAWCSIAGSFVISVISIIQIIAFDSKVSAKNFQISQAFYEIKEDIKSLLSEYNSKPCKDQILLRKYKILQERYSNTRERYVEYMSANKSYYYSKSPGKIRPIDKIKMEAIDREDENIFER